MKRDLGLVRELLLHLEVLPIAMYGAITIGPDSPEITVEGYNEEDITCHFYKSAASLRFLTGNP